MPNSKEILGLFYKHKIVPAAFHFPRVEAPSLSFFSLSATMYTARPWWPAGKSINQEGFLGSFIDQGKRERGKEKKEETAPNILESEAIKP